MDSVEPDAEAGKPRAKRRRIRRPLVLTLALCCCATLAVGGWEARQGSRARAQLTRALAASELLQQQLLRGDHEESRATLGVLTRETGAARAATRDPVWRGGGHAPGVGDDIRAVRTLIAVLDDLARQVLPAMVDFAGNLDALLPRDGRVDVTAFAVAASGLPAAQIAIRALRDRVAAISTGRLVDRLSAPVVQLRTKLDRAVALTDAAMRAAQLIPAMMGLQGPRTYLFLFQNLAEVRATGGMPGAYLVIAVDHGAIRVADVGSASGGLRVSDTPVLPLDPAMTALYTDSIGRYPANINLTPHFPTVAMLAREMYRRASGRTVDGVLATDPVALSYLLGAIGPVTVGSGPAITAENAVRHLLSEVYAGPLSPDEQDSYFRAVAKATFEALIGRPLDVRTALMALRRAAGERRLLIWNAQPDEEQLIAGIVLDGVLPADRPDAPTVGVFLNDGGAGRLSYYLRPAAELGVGGCRIADRMPLLLRVTLSSTAPPSGLSTYVRNSATTVPPYTLRTHVLIFSPTAGTIVDARLDGTVIPLATGREGRRAVGLVTVDVPPGSSSVLQVTVLTAPRQEVGAVLTPKLWTTPTVTPWRLEYPPAAQC